MAVSNVELIVNAAKAINPLKRVTAETKKLEGATRDVNGRLRDSKGRFVAVGKSAKQASKGVNSLTGSIKGLLTAAAAIGTAKFIIFKTAELETQTRSLQVLTGSLNNAQKIIEELQAFGAVTPFTSSELIETAKRLKAFGFETEQIVDVTKRLGDVAGATGADLSGIATAFGQIQAKGRLQGEELLQLQERGVDLAGTLKKEYGLTGEEFQKALQKGQIGADAVNFALIKLTENGGKYANGAIAQSDTLAGKFSTIQDGIGRLATAVGTTLEPAIKIVLDLAIQAVNEITTLLGKGAEARNFGLNQRQLDAIDRKAKETADLISGKRGYGMFDPRRMLLQAQIARDMLRQYGFESGQLQLPTEAKTPQIERPELGLGTVPKGGKSGKTEAERQADALKQQQKSAAALLLSKKQEALLMGDITEEQRAGLEHAIEKMNLKRQFPNLSEDELQVLRDQLDINFGLSKEDKERLANAKKLKDAQDAEKKRADELKGIYQGIGDTISDGVVNALKGAVTGTQSLAEAATNMLNSLIDQMLQLATNMLLFGNITGTMSAGSGILGSLFGGFMANGGTTMPGKSYIVGEKGPELFTPGRTGSIAPNDAFGGANIVVNVDASGSSVEGDAQQSKALGQALGAAVKAELIKQKMPGGLLA